MLQGFVNKSIMGRRWPGGQQIATFVDNRAREKGPRSAIRFQLSVPAFRCQICVFSLRLFFSQQLIAHSILILKLSFHLPEKEWQT